MGGSKTRTSFANPAYPAIPRGENAPTHAKPSPAVMSRTKTCEIHRYPPPYDKGEVESVRGGHEH